VIVRFADGKVRSEHTYYRLEGGPPVRGSTLAGTPGATPIRKREG
jgi:hypothetical protein